MGHQGHTLKRTFKVLIGKNFRRREISDERKWETTKI